MSHTNMADQAYTRDLGDGLLLRWSTAADTERIGTLYSQVFLRDANDTNPFLPRLTHELMHGHPQSTANDFALVERTSDGAIVAATCLMGQTLRYDGTSFPMGRPELVASLAEYRNRGLVRAIFELIHARSDARGDMVQGITGISYYYRQFGYEYALDLAGHKTVPFTNIPKLKEGETEAYALRDASESDLPLIQRLYERECVRVHNGAPLLATTQISESYWHFALSTAQRGSGEGFLLRVIENREGRGVGYVILHPMRWGEELIVRGMMVDEGISLLHVLPSVLRALPAESEKPIKRRDDVGAATKVEFGFGRAHPVYDALGDTAIAGDNPYAWYVRVRDVPAFIHHIKPVLEQRLADSYAAEHTGELRLTFYRGGMRLVFDQGHISAEPWQQDHNYGPKPQAGFPPLVFLQLLFGHRSFDEIRGFLHDAWAEDEARKLLNILFPKRVSWVVGLE